MQPFSLVSEAGYSSRDACSHCYLLFLILCVCLLLLVTFDADCLSADRFHVHCQVILLELILMLRIRGVRSVHFRRDREDVVVEVVVFLGLMSYLVLSHPIKE